MAEGSAVLKPRGFIGYNGDVVYALQLHPDGNILMSIGNKLVLKHAKTCEQSFFIGHSNKISCFAISRSGKYLGSGQINHIGFKAPVILWDYESISELARHDLHKVSVAAIAFSAGEKYLFTVGGIDDGSVIVFDVESRTPFLQCNAANGISGFPNFICPFKKHEDWFIISGDNHLRMWKIRSELKKLSVYDVNVGRQRRKYTQMIIDDNDENAFLGTMSGDIAHIRIREDPETHFITAVLIGLYGTLNPKKPVGKNVNKYVNGIRNLILLENKNILLASGDGTVELVEFRNENFKKFPNPTWPELKTLKSCKVNGAVTSLCRKSGSIYSIGTEYCEIYELDINTFNNKLVLTCPTSSNNQIVFPKNNSNVFAVACKESIRIWSSKQLLELLRIIVYNFECTGVAFRADGTNIMSVWNDGTIRCFTPITGRLIFAIPNAHNKGCSALVLSNNGRTLVTAGFEGQVRVWKIEPIRQSLIAVLKDHSSSISSLHFNADETEVVSAGTDGCCIIWDVIRLTSKLVIRANTQFTCAQFHPTGVQLLTTGTGGTIGYWMVFNGSLLRELVASEKESVESLFIHPTGKYFISAGVDTIVNLWDYQNGVIIATGMQHASSVACSAISPCGKFCITGSVMGTLIIWDLPQQCWPEKTPPAEPVPTTTAPKKTRDKPVENIDKLESSRKNKAILCAECPPVDTSAQPNIDKNCVGHTKK